MFFAKTHTEDALSSVAAIVFFFCLTFFFSVFCVFLERKDNRMPSGNGNRAKQKRERNMKRAAAKSSAHSQLKVNAAAQTIVCKMCRQTFMCTASDKELHEHAENRHPKAEFSACFDPRE